ncbi:MAG: hypothetical protein ACR2PK_05825 [Acidimicrobiales bacterium]
MLLGSSSQALGAPADERVVVSDQGSNDAVDAGVEAGRELIDFTDAAHALDESLEGAREQLGDRLGHEAMVDAAVIAAVFRGLNIAADTSGIRVDDDWVGVAQRQMEVLGTQSFRTLANNPWASATNS